jgi:NAD(P)-dependent dehydrogenase (short-subunit alcohol dehydrogenase family)
VVEQCRRSSAGGEIEFLPADLADSVAVRALADSILERTECVDILVNNAGARIDRYQQNSAGIEMTFAVNHVGHFLLTHLLRTRLERSRIARVITVGSSAHLGADLSLGWNLPRERYDRRIAYANSKLANIVFARELHSRWSSMGVSSCAVDPGLVATRFARNNGILSWMKHLVAHGLRGELISARRAADTIVHLATAGWTQQIGGNYVRCRNVLSPSPEALRSDVGQDLWSLSLRLTGLSAGHLAG